MYSGCWFGCTGVAGEEGVVTVRFFQKSKLVKGGIVV